MHYIFLAVAIASEVVGTTALKSAEGFTRLGPSAIVVAGYGSAFYFLSLCLERFAVGIAYATWSGVGIVLGLLVHGQKLDFPAVAGMGLIVAGVAVINLWSSTQLH